MQSGLACRPWHIIQAGLKTAILLSQFPKCWDYKHILTTLPSKNKYLREGQKSTKPLKAKVEEVLELIRKSKIRAGEMAEELGALTTSREGRTMVQFPAPHPQGSSQLSEAPVSRI